MTTLLKYSVGIDMSKDDFHVCISVIDNHQKVTIKSSTKFANTQSGFANLVMWIEKHKKLEIPIFVCMEATGIYHENCAYYLNDKGFKVSIILPNKAKKYMESSGIKSKNDPVDAKGLAQMGAEKSLDVWQPMGYFFYILRLMTRQYQNIIETASCATNQLHALKLAANQSDIVTLQINETILHLKKQKKDMKKAIILHLKTDALLYKKFLKVCTVKGLGEISVATIIAETNGFELFVNYKQVVSYAGYDVIENSSGTRIGKTKISKQGNSRIRRILFMPALCVIKNRFHFIDLYDRIVEKTGIKMKGCVAVQKKLLVMTYVLWKNDEEFDSQHISKAALPEKSSLNQESEATQDHPTEANFPKTQNYEKINKKPKEIQSNSKNIKQPRRNSKMPKIPVQ